MRSRLWSTLTQIGAAWACAFAVQAQTAAASAPEAADAGVVRAWLMRIHEAAGKRNFQGTFVVSGAGSVSSAHIAHYCEGANQYERVDTLDGQKRHVFRHNEVVHTLWPASRVALVEQRNLLMSFPALLQAGDDGITDFYEVRKQGVDRVAGHDAHVLLLSPKDRHRYGYRLWSDQASGLLLRADVLGEQSQVLETSAFSDVVIGIKPQPESVLQPMKKLDGYRVVRPAMTPTHFENEGWTLRQSVPGFKQVSCVKRPMSGTDAEVDKRATGQVLQAIFSDGLTYVSVFVEPYEGQRNGRPMVASVGATQTLMKQHGDWWVTVVGDVPPATLRLFADGLERRK